jgi:hypothetical protein
MQSLNYFYGYAKEFSDERMSKENWENKFLDTIKKKFNEKLVLCVKIMYLKKI